MKSGDRSNASNDRPITNLPIIGKIIEKTVHTQLYTFLKENKLLAPKQFGSRPNLPFEMALTHLTENILDNMDNRLVRVPRPQQGLRYCSPPVFPQETEISRSG